MTDLAAPRFRGDPGDTPLTDPSRWHYRRSLASRVTLLTTLAVALAVAFVALGAYVTVRMQMQSTLDESLLERAEQAADAGVLANTIAPGATSPRACSGRPTYASSCRSATRRGAPTDPGPRPRQPELHVLTGTSPHSIRTLSADGVRWRVVTVPSGDGQALVIAQSLEPQEQVLAKLGVVMLLFGLAGVIAAGWRAGPWPATACARSAD